MASDDLQRRVVLGVTWQGGADPRSGPASRFATWLGEKLGRRVSLRVALSYAELGNMMHFGGADIAWVPPLVYVKLERQEAAVPLVKLERRGQAGYHAALIVHSDSPIDDLDALFGSTAAWVDRYSAAGFVIPRAVLSSRGLPPETVFREERFYGSHDAVVRAVLSGRAHAGGTFARLDESGKVSPTTWSHIPNATGRLRTLMTFGAIPGDVIAVRPSMDEATRRQLADVFLAAGSDPVAGPLVREVFGAEAFREGPLEGYEIFREAIID